MCLSESDDLILVTLDDHLISRKYKLSMKNMKLEFIEECETIEEAKKFWNKS